MTKITLEYFGMTGTGATVKEAKQDAGVKLTAAMSKHYEPKIFQWKSHIGLVWNTPREVCSGYVHDGRISGVCCNGIDDFDTTCMRMRYNLAQNGADIFDDEIPAIIAKDKDIHRDYARWLGFQRAFKHSEKINPAPFDHHRWACDHDREFVPVLRFYDNND